MHTKREILMFDGLSGAVSLCVDQKFRAALPTVFPNWGHHIGPASGIEIFLHIEWVDGEYTLTSPFMSAPSSFADPVNTLCAMIVELAWQRLREDPQLLCLHGAAVEFAGRLLIFPSTRRAGKSTLTVAMAAAGKNVFTDDFLPISITGNGQVHGVASGIAPRLRLPTPPQFGALAEGFIKRRNMIANRQYQFVSLRKTELASFGTTAPIGGMIFLERQVSEPASIKPVIQADALKALITQNFSRAMNAAGILQMLAFITSSAPAYRLIYDDTESAVTLLDQHFAKWDTPAPQLDGPLEDVATASALDIPRNFTHLDVTAGQFVQTEGVTVISSDGKKFLTGRDGQSIHFLNDGAAAIWHLLAEPTSLIEAIELLCSAFPGQPTTQIEQDVTATFTELARNNLLRANPPICQSDNSEASYTDSLYQESV